MQGMIDIKLVAFLHNPPYVAEMKKQPGHWAKLRVCLRLPNQVRNGEIIPGGLRYFTVLAFGPLATRIKEEALVVGDWLIITVGDVRSSVWIDTRTNKPRSGVEMFAEDIDFKPPRELVAELTAAAQSSPIPVTAD